jgi:hypothetical protein
MNDHGGVLCPQPIGFERDDCRESECAMSIDRVRRGWSIARLQRIRPDQGPVPGQVPDLVDG